MAVRHDGVRGVMRWLRDRWYARLRRIDVAILWPSCKKAAKGDLDRARAAFASHAYKDYAWRVLGDDEIYRRIDGLR